MHVEAGGYSRVCVDGYQWFALDSFIDSAESPYDRFYYHVTREKGFSYLKLILTT